MILAVGGIIASWVGRQGRAQTWLLVVVTVAAILGPLEQARLHTAASLDKHVGLGAWFAAIAAGFAVDRFIEAAHAGRNEAAHGARKTRNFTLGACVLALAFPVSLGASQSWSFATDWPNAATFVAILRPLTSTAVDTCWWRTLLFPSTTCPPGPTGSGGQAPGTSSCRRDGARAARARPRVWSDLAMPAPSPPTSPRGTSPSSP